ncbi:MAG TPA: hypothetical protein VES68_03150 [Candidatus Sulfotelmatobacter sp.]|nr:hypothetical protein [Candidatus Sulfotelmatobacter sp.]
MKFFLFLLLIFSLIFESSISTIPLIFAILLIFTLIYKKNYIFFIAFILGIFFDALSFRSIGLSSIFLTIFLFLVLIYQSKFEIATRGFVLLSSFFGSLGYLLFLGINNYVLFQSILTSLLSVFLFIFIKDFGKTNPQTFNKI